MRCCDCECARMSLRLIYTIKPESKSSNRNKFPKRSHWYIYNTHTHRVFIRYKRSQNKKTIIGKDKVQFVWMIQWNEIKKSNPVHSSWREKSFRLVAIENWLNLNVIRRVAVAMAAATGVYLRPIRYSLFVFLPWMLSLSFSFLSQRECRVYTNRNEPLTCCCCYSNNDDQTA